MSPPSSPGSPARAVSSMRAVGSARASKRLQFSHPVVQHSQSMADSDVFSPRKGSHLQLDSANMLPTPSKTPRRSHLAPETGLFSGRALFPSRLATVDDAMPSSSRKGRRSKKQTALTLESFLDADKADDGEGIEIYTDCKERVPAVDDDDDNPFVGPAKARSTRSRIAAEDSREDGMVYVL